MSHTSVKSFRILRKVSGMKITILVFLAAALAYLPLMANELTNTYDGLWKGSYYVGYGWTIRMGRWIWPFVGLARGNISPEPITSLLTIAMMVLGAVVAVSLLEDRNRHRFLFILAAVSISVNTANLSRLSYRFQSPTFGFGFLCSVLAVWVSRRMTGWGRWRWLAAGALLVCTLGSYQGDLGCSCLLVLLLLLKDLAAEVDLRQIWAGLWRAVLTALVSCVVYKLIWDLFLKLLHLDAADYKGADSLSVVGLILHLGTGVRDAFRGWFTYFWSGEGIRGMAFQKYGFHRFLFLLSILMALLMVGRVFRDTRERGENPLRPLLLTVGFLLMPVCAGVFMLLSTEGSKLEIQLTMPYAMVFPLVSILFVNVWEREPDKRRNPAVVSVALFLTLLIYGTFLQVSTDQHTMRAGRQSAIALAERMSMELDWLGYSGEEIIFVGRPSDNPQFVKDELWEKANEYARYGDFWLGGNCSTESWKGLLRDAGVGIRIHEDFDLWDRISEKKTVKKMPLFPAEGSLRRIDGHLVIKVGESQ